MGEVRPVVGAGMGGGVGYQVTQEGTANDQGNGGVIQAGEDVRKGVMGCGGGAGGGSRKVNSVDYQGWLKPY